MRAVFFLAYCQLFGGKSPPLNFARYPAWLCEVAAVLFGLPVSHCVDDMISVEPTILAFLGQRCFVELCRATGWEISEGKPPPPSSRFVVIGVELDLDEGSLTFYRNGKAFGPGFSGVTGPVVRAVAKGGGGTAVKVLDWNRRQTLKGFFHQTLNGSETQP